MLDGAYQHAGVKVDSIYSLLRIVHLIIFCQLGILGVANSTSRATNGNGCASNGSLDIVVNLCVAIIRLC